MRSRYRFKRAETPQELDACSRLNHDVFASELAQHHRDPSGRLVDKFDAKNTYLIALVDEAVIGMIALHDEPPFSVAGKLSDPERELAPFGRLIEVRLLAVEAAHRNGRVMAGLMLALHQHARYYDTIIISGHADKASIYHELGFHDLGPAVPSGAAWYIPMAVRVAELAERQARWQRRLGTAQVNL